MEKTTTVLIVDDNDILIATLRDGLEDMGYIVYAANDGAMALDAYDEHHPDVIVIDIKMPRIDGHQLMRAFRGDPETAITPLIMMTALPQREEQLTGLYSGADAFLLKPVTSRELGAAITNVLVITPHERAARMQRFYETGEHIREA